MTNKNLPILLAGVGLVAAWYWSRRQSAQLASLLANVPQGPSSVLPSHAIGDGYIHPITGGTGLPRMSYDPASGDVMPDLGTDLILPAIDPYDPSLPGHDPINKDLIDAARADMLGLGAGGPGQSTWAPPGWMEDNE